MAATSPAGAAQARAAGASPARSSGSSCSPRLTVRDNIRVAGEIRHRWRGSLRGLGETSLGRSRRDDRPDRSRRRRRREVSAIPTGQARVVELGRALMPASPPCCCSTSRRRGRTRARRPRSGRCSRRLVAEASRLPRRARRGTGDGRVRPDPRARLRRDHRRRHARRDAGRTRRCSMPTSEVTCDRTEHDRSASRAQRNPRRLRDRSTCSTASTSPWRTARSTPCSGPTVPASRPR